MTGQCGMTYAYNDANKLTAATDTTGTTDRTQRYTYDGDGNRLTASTGLTATDTTTYRWDINNELPQLVRENNGNDQLLRRYVHGLDTISMTVGGGTSYYYAYDGLGSVTDVTDSTGNRVIEYGYEAFGDLRINTQTAGAPTNLLRYTGEYYDTFTDTYHLRARQYDSHLGRFTQIDPAAASASDPCISANVYVANQATRGGRPKWAETSSMYSTTFLETPKTSSRLRSRYLRLSYPRSPRPRSSRRESRPRSQSSEHSMTTMIVMLNKSESLL